MMKRTFSVNLAVSFEVDASEGGPEALLAVLVPGIIAPAIAAQIEEDVRKSVTDPGVTILRVKADATYLPTEADG